MKKSVLLLVVYLCLSQSLLFAGSIDYLTNQSAKIAVTFHRTASTDAAADIANYNPAGTAFLEKGLYLDLSNQMLFKIYNSQSTDASSVTRTYDQNEPTYVLPNFYAVYNFGKIGPGRHAIYLQMGIVAGGGSLKWKNGTIGTYAAYQKSFSNPLLGADVENHSFEAYSVYYGIGLGVAYSFFDDILAISLGIRFVIPDRFVQLSAQSTNSLIVGGKISLDGKFKYSSFGITPIIGIDVRPIKGLTIGFRYEAETNLHFEYKKDYLNVDPESILFGAVNIYNIVKDGLADGGLSDGNKFNYNLPHILTLGIEYDMSFLVKGLSIMTSATVYLLQFADLGQYYDSSDGNGTPDPIGNVSEFFGIGWETGLGVTWKIISELNLGMGFMYSTPGTKKSYFTSSYTMLTCSANPPLDSLTFGLGGTWFFKSIGLDVTLAFTWTHYLPFEGDLSTAAGDFNIEYKKDVYNIAIGLGYQLQFDKKKKKKTFPK